MQWWYHQRINFRLPACAPSWAQVTADEFNDDGAYCNEPEEYKLVLGQGQPNVTSRFKDPTDPANSAWKPTSVPSVQAQSWSANYKDGLCGLRRMDDG